MLSLFNISADTTNLKDKALKGIGFSVLMALITTHMSSFKFFPTHPEYQFPVQHFLANVTLIVIIVAGLEYIFLKVTERYSDRDKYRFTIFLGLSTAFVTVFMTIAHLLVIDILNYPYDFYSLTLSVSGTLGLSTLYLYILYPRRFTTATLHSGSSGHIKVKSGVKLYNIPTDQIYAFVLTSKMTFLVDIHGKRLLTNFNLQELEEKLDPELFFRANRQCIIRKDTISSVRSLPNNSVRVILSDEIAHVDPIIISRHKASAFRKWFAE